MKEIIANWSWDSFWIGAAAMFVFLTVVLRDKWAKWLVTRKNFILLASTAVVLAVIFAGIKLISIVGPAIDAAIEASKLPKWIPVTVILFLIAVVVFIAIKLVGHWKKTNSNFE